MTFEWMSKREKFSPQIRLTFLSAFFTGLLAHGVGILNKYSWFDDITYLFDVGHTATSGRWMLHILAWLETVIYQDGGHFSMPLFNGILSLLLLSVSACLIVDLLQLRKRITCAALGCIMAVFPVITSLFTYMFTAHFYMLAMLMTVLAAWLICRKGRWWAWVLAVALGGSAMGIYQAFIPMLLAILLLADLMPLSETNTQPASFGKHLLLQGLCVVGMFILYFAMNRLLLARLGLSLSGYMGIDRAGREPLQTYLSRVGTAYREFFLPSQGAMWDMYPHRLYTMYQLMLLGNVLMGIRLLFRTQKQKVWKMAAMGVLFAIFPMACNGIFVMSETVHGLMVYPQVMQFVMLAWMWDRMEFEKLSMRRTVSLLSAFFFAATGLLYIRLDNQCYLKMELQQQEAISWLTALVSQIKASPDYRVDRPVLFWDDEITDPTITTLRELETIRTWGYQYSTREMLSVRSEWQEPMERWCGFTPIYCEDRSILEKPEVQAMPHYPDAGSIQVIEDVLVVRF